MDSLAILTSLSETIIPAGERYAGWTFAEACEDHAFCEAAARKTSGSASRRALASLVSYLL